MPCAAAFKRVLNVFVPNQVENLDRTHRNTHASSSSFQEGQHNLYWRGVTAAAPKVQMISTTTAEDDHYSYLNSHDLMESRLLDHDADSDMTAELDHDEDAGPSSATKPIVFSEDPLTCSNEMLAFANDLVDVAVTKMAESVEIMDASHIKDLSRWKQRLDRTSETIVDTDTPTVRLLKARTYLMDAGELLKRVIIVVEHATRLEIFESAEWHV